MSKLKIYFNADKGVDFSKAQELLESQGFTVDIVKCGEYVDNVKNKKKELEETFDEKNSNFEIPIMDGEGDKSSSDPLSSLIQTENDSVFPKPETVKEETIPEDTLGEKIIEARGLSGNIHPLSIRQDRIASVDVYSEKKVRCFLTTNHLKLCKEAQCSYIGSVEFNNALKEKGVVNIATHFENEPKASVNYTRKLSRLMRSLEKLLKYITLNDANPEMKEAIRSSREQLYMQEKEILEEIEKEVKANNMDVNDITIYLPACVMAKGMMEDMCPLYKRDITCDFFDPDVDIASIVVK